MMEIMRRIPKITLYCRSFVGRVKRIRRCCQCEHSVCSIVKTKSVVAKSRVNESGPKLEGNESENSY